MELEFAQSAPKLEWSIFDRRLIHIQGVVPCSPTAAATETSTGQNVCVSLRLVPPPLSSYVEIYTDDSFSFYGHPHIIAAHGDLVLIYGVIAVKGEGAGSYPGNFFLYKASPAASAWLRRLPPPPPGNCWRGHVLFTGVLHHEGGDDFVVANLQALVGARGEEVAEIFRYSSGSEEWDFFQIDMPGDAASGFYPQSWYTDTVFSHDSFIYWVDYHQGMISADMSVERPHLQFIKFPGIETKVDFIEGRGLPETLRTAAVTRGRIWFVDVDDGRFRSRSSSTYPSSVTTWSLKGTEWVREHTLELSNLWLALKYQDSPLPGTVPEFPMLDLQEDGILHFIVRECVDSAEHWIATVDMKTSSLMTQKKYLNQIEAPYLPFKVTNMFWDKALLCSQLCRSFNLPAGD